MWLLLLIVLVVFIVVPLWVRHDRQVARNAPYRPAPYTVQAHDDATKCEECEGSLLAGETAYQTDSFTHAYCSLACAKRAQMRPQR
jgi:hypothetical protein